MLWSESCNLVNFSTKLFTEALAFNNSIYENPPPDRMFANQ